MLIGSLVSLSVMLFGCLDLDSCSGMRHVVEHKYGILLPSTSDDRTATPGNFGNVDDSMSLSPFPMSPFPFPASERFVLTNPHDRVNFSLGPKTIKHSKLTPEQSQKAKVFGQLKAQEKR